LTHIRDYTDRFWIEKSKYVYCRIQIGHGKDKEKVVSDTILSWCKGKDMAVFIASIQAKVVSTICWLAFSHHSMNARNITDNLNQHPLLLEGKYTVALRSRAIRLAPREKVPFEEQVKSLHVDCAQADAKKIQAIISKIYGSSNEEGYPPGQVMRAVPNTSDPRTIVTKKTKQNVQRIKAKHKALLNKTERSLYWGIAILNHYLDKVEGMLHQCIMNIPSVNKTDRGFYLSVDEQYTGGTCVFLYNKDIADEARYFVLCLIPFLRKKYGNCIKSWFHEDEWEAMQEYKLDGKT
jgi:hypothetical protein